MVPSVQKELRKGLLVLKVFEVPTPKAPKVLTSLNAIVVEHECDPIINVQCNGSLLDIMLVDGRAEVNVMTIPTMKYLRLKINILTSVTLKMANKHIVRS
jgi:hypothetical protein